VPPPVITATIPSTLKRELGSKAGEDFIVAGTIEGYDHKLYKCSCGEVLRDSVNVSRVDSTFNTAIATRVGQQIGHEIQTSMGLWKVGMLAAAANAPSSIVHVVRASPRPDLRDLYRD
jgi:hypothetical protein